MHGASEDIPKSKKDEGKGIMNQAGILEVFAGFLLIGTGVGLIVVGIWSLITYWGDVFK
jgi:hypothetical protein